MMPNFALLETESAHQMYANESGTDPMRYAQNIGSVVLWRRARR